MSAIGTSRRFAEAPLSVAFGGKADIRSGTENDANDPKATSERKRDKKYQLSLRSLAAQKRAVSATLMDEQTTVQARICAAWIDLLRRNRGAEGHPEQYCALNVENIAGQGAEFELHVTFRAGRTYCCCQGLCHTGVFTEQRWRELRLAAREPLSRA